MSRALEDLIVDFPQFKKTILSLWDSDNYSDISLWENGFLSDEEKAFDIKSDIEKMLIPNGILSDSDYGFSDNSEMAS